MTTHRQLIERWRERAAGYQTRAESDPSLTGRTACQQHAETIRQCTAEHLTVGEQREPPVAHAGSRAAHPDRGTGEGDGASRARQATSGERPQPHLTVCSLAELPAALKDAIAGGAR